LASVLGLTAFHVDAAVRLFMLALQHNFVKGGDPTSKILDN